MGLAVCFLGPLRGPSQLACRRGAVRVKNPNCPVCCNCAALCGCSSSRRVASGDWVQRLPVMVVTAIGTDGCSRRASAQHGGGARLQRGAMATGDQWWFATVTRRRRHATEADASGIVVAGDQWRFATVSLQRLRASSVVAAWLRNRRQHTGACDAAGSRRRGDWAACQA